MARIMKADERTNQETGRKKSGVRIPVMLNNLVALVTPPGCQSL